MSFKHLMRHACALALVGTVTTATAGNWIIDAGRVLTVAVNGGGDSNNPGVTCMRVTDPVSPTCQSGFVAIRNSNKLLVAAALQAKATNAPIVLYYSDEGGSHHCPGYVFTPCSVISLEVK